MTRRSAAKAVIETGSGWWARVRMAVSVAQLRRLGATAQSRLTDTRGDVPGWVLVTVMTAGLVTALWLIADSELKAILARALAAVSIR